MDLSDEYPNIDITVLWHRLLNVLIRKPKLQPYDALLLERVNRGPCLRIIQIFDANNVVRRRLQNARRRLRGMLRSHAGHGRRSGFYKLTRLSEDQLWINVSMRNTSAARTLAGGSFKLEWSTASTSWESPRR